MTRHVLPSFSVIMANYNYADFVGDAIRSALDQDYPPELVEVIVVDDGSTDRSRQVIEGLAGNPRLRVVLQDNRGQSAAFEAGVALARGDFVCFLDSDDLFLPSKLTRVARRIAELDVEPDSLLLCHDLHIVDVIQDRMLERGWFATMGIDRLGDALDPAAIDNLYPFSIPCGQVMGRRLAAACLAALPPWAFPCGTDTPLCMAAMLATWRVCYLHEPLGLYRVHGGNDAARIVDGRYRVGLRWRERTPRLLAFLERWVDSLDLPVPERQARLGCLRRIEHLSRVPSPQRRLAVPQVSLITTPGATTAHTWSSVQSSLEQTHGALEVLVDGLAPLDRERLDGFGIRVQGVAPHEAMDDLGVLAAAYRQASGDYLMFLRGGDRLDRECIERHLHWRQHGAMVGVSCNDVRLATPEGALVHADVFANSGAWKPALQQVPPLATGLKDWVAPPISACLFRRSEFLDRMFAEVDQMPAALRCAGAWLLVHLQHHTAGVLRIRETLTTVLLADGAAASYGYLASPAALDGHLVDAPVQAGAIWLEGFFDREQNLFRRWLPQSWHRHFRTWLTRQTSG